MDSISELRAALTLETGRRELAAVRLAECHRPLAEAHKTTNPKFPLASRRVGL